MHVFYGSLRVEVKETRKLAKGDWELTGRPEPFGDCVLWVGAGTDLETLLFRMNLDGADLRWLKGLNIAQP